MKLVEKLKNGTEMYRLDDGRLGKIYPKSGYVRVTTLRQGIINGKYWSKDSTKDNRWYQINKKEKYKDKGMKFSHVRRILIPKRKDQLAFLKAFNAKNADKVIQMKKMLEGYAKGLRWFSNFEAEKRALLHINLNDKLNEIKGALKSIEKDVTSSNFWK
tara:strand:+ start:464 stop:940 length:477 start_codon:yes stop_codon:yes gene_type:complete